MSKISLLEFYTKYYTVNGKKPIITDKDKWLIDNLSDGNIQRVWTHKYGWQYKQINQNKDE
jgi:hypothetical protein